MPQFSSRIFTNGATLLVVQEALENKGVFQSKSESLMPSTTVGTSLSGEGAEIITCPAPDCKCSSAFSLLVNRPVDSMTISMAKSFQGNAAGLLSFVTNMLCLPT